MNEIHRYIREWNDMDDPNLTWDYDDASSDSEITELSKPTTGTVPKFLGTLRPPSYIASPFVVRQGVLARSHPTFMLMRSAEIRITGAIKRLSDSMGDLREILLEEREKAYPNLTNSQLTKKGFCISEPSSVSTRIPHLWQHYPVTVTQQLPEVKKRGDLEVLLEYLPQFWAHYAESETEKLLNYGKNRRKIAAPVIEKTLETNKSILQDSNVLIKTIKKKAPLLPKAK